MYSQILTSTPLGIGLAVAKYLLTAPQSHNVVVVARSVEPLQKLKDQYGKQVAVLNGDLSDFSLAQQAVDTAIKTFGQLDGMVLNHGLLGQIGKISDADPQQWKEGFDINFISLVAFVRHLHQIYNALLTESRPKRLSRLSVSPKEKSSSRLQVQQSPVTVVGLSMLPPKPP